MANPLSQTRRITDVQGDNETELPAIYRPTLACLFNRYRVLLEDIKLLDQQIDASVKSNQACHELTALEDVGPISAILLFATLGTGEAFKNGREFSAYIGLTPKQYSSGGKHNIIGISKHVANRRLRAVLIQCARAYVYRMKAVASSEILKYF